MISHVDAIYIYVPACSAVRGAKTRERFFSTISKNNHRVRRHNTYVISPVRAVMIHYVRRLAWNRDTYIVSSLWEHERILYTTDARCGRPLCVRSPAAADHNILFGARVCVKCKFVCVWRALCGCPANASINCVRAPPSTATATPTRTTRRRLSLLVATACITRSFPPVRSSSSVRPPPSFVRVRFRVFPLFPYARDTIVRPFVIYLFIIFFFKPC